MKKYKRLIKEAIKDLKNKDTRYKQIPNLLTSSRLFAPIFIIPAALFGNIIITAIITGLFGLTDLFDGIIARKYNIQSELGEVLDAVTDKIFSGTILIALSFTNPILIVNILLELVIALINISKEKKGTKAKSNKIGKIKTWSLFALVAASIVNPVLNISKVINTLFIITTLMQSATALSYIKDDNKDKDIKTKEKSNTTDLNYELEEEKELDVKETVVPKINEVFELDEGSYELPYSSLQDDISKPKTLELKK